MKKEPLGHLFFPFLDTSASCFSTWVEVFLKEPVKIWKRLYFPSPRLHSLHLVGFVNMRSICLGDTENSVGKWKGQNCFPSSIKDLKITSHARSGAWIPPLLTSTPPRCLSNFPPEQGEEKLLRYSLVRKRAGLKAFFTKPPL